MDHSEAASGQAVERYLLGEMSASEAELFELHFFECTICTEELTGGALLEDGIREAAAEPVVEERGDFSSFRHWWSRPLFAAPAFATVALALVVGYQAQQLALLRQPQALVAYTLISDTQLRSRGGAAGNQIRADRPDIAVNVELSDTAFPRYKFDLYDGGGRLIRSVENQAPQPGNPLSMVIPRGLAPGAYTLKVQGLGGAASAPVMDYPIQAVR